MKNVIFNMIFCMNICLLNECFCDHTIIHNHGYWCGEEVDKQHLFDFKLAKALARFFINEKAESVVDFGCGMGEYVKVLQNQDICTEGYDGNPDTVKLTDGLAQVIDLSQPFDLGKKFDWVLSIEVGEHIPKKFEKKFIENLHIHNVKGIVLSWAVKGQGGFGHFNEQNNDYIKKVMMEYGYCNDVEAENQLRNQSTLPWFKNTIMVFRKI